MNLKLKISKSQAEYLLQKTKYQYDIGECDFVWLNNNCYIESDKNHELSLVIPDDLFDEFS